MDTDKVEDNVQKIRHNVNATIKNIEAADKAIAKGCDAGSKEYIKSKNKNRHDAIADMREKLSKEIDGK